MDTLDKLKRIAGWEEGHIVPDGWDEGHSTPDEDPSRGPSPALPSEVDDRGGPEKTAEWKGWSPDMPVEVVTTKGTDIFPNLAEAQKKYPVDPARNSHGFTWAMKGKIKGKEAIRFEDMATYREMSRAGSTPMASLERLAVGCPDNMPEGSPACVEWEANTEKYKDVVKDKHREGLARSKSARNWWETGDQVFKVQDSKGRVVELEGTYDEVSRQILRQQLKMQSVKGPGYGTWTVIRKANDPKGGREKQAVAGPDTVGRNWKNITDHKGMRWLWSDRVSNISFAVYEISGPGRPLYRLQVILEDGTMLKFNRQLPDPKIMFKIAAKMFQSLVSDASGGTVFTGWSKMSKEARKQMLMPRSIASKIPKLYSQEDNPDPIAWVKFFNAYGRGTWLITEFDGHDRMFGLADLGFPELGYISLGELESLEKMPGLQQIERDTSFRPKPLSEAAKKEHINWSLRSAALHTLQRLAGEKDLKVTMEKLASRPLNEIAREIRQDWKNVNYGAKPYLDAMEDLRDINDNYFQDSGQSIVGYFLSNARSWRGPVAKRIKAELKAMLGRRGSSDWDASLALERMTGEVPGVPDGTGPWGETSQCPFSEGEAGDEVMAEGCPDNMPEGTPECAKWESNTDKYKDVVKDKHREAGFDPLLALGRMAGGQKPDKTAGEDWFISDDSTALVKDVFRLIQREGGKGRIKADHLIDINFPLDSGKMMPLEIEIWEGDYGGFIVNVNLKPRMPLPVRTNRKTNAKQIVQAIKDAIEEVVNWKNAARGSTRTAARPLYVIAREIQNDWKKVNFGAKPYLEAMFNLNAITDNYFMDKGSFIVGYFLSNSRTWRGPVAKRVKKELQDMLKQSRMSAMVALEELAAGCPDNLDESKCASRVAAHHQEGKDWYVDTAFINASKRFYPRSELRHLGFGEFELVTPDGTLQFDRMRGKDFPGQSGRSHKLYDDAHGKVIAKAIQYAERANQSEHLAAAGIKKKVTDWMWVLSKDSAGGFIVTLGDPKKSSSKIKARFSDKDSAKQELKSWVKDNVGKKVSPNHIIDLTGQKLVPDTWDQKFIDSLPKLQQAKLAADPMSALEQLARFEEGKPADPTKNMSPEDAAKWKAENEKHKDKFKAACQCDDGGSPCPICTSKTGMEHATEEARKKYLQEHPDADPKNHTIKSEGEGGGDKKDDGGGDKKKKKEKLQELGARGSLRETMQGMSDAELEEAVQLLDTESTIHHLKDVVGDLEKIQTFDTGSDNEEDKKWRADNAKLLGRLKKVLPQGEPKTAADPRAEIAMVMSDLLDGFLKYVEPDTLGDLKVFKAHQNALVYATSDLAADVRTKDQDGKPGTQFKRGPGRVVSMPPHLSLETANWWGDQRDAVQYTLARKAMERKAKRLHIEWPVAQGIRSASDEGMDPDELLARFEEGKPADPCENMSEAECAEWKSNTDKYKDKFKAASFVQGKKVTRIQEMRDIVKEMGVGDTMIIWVDNRPWKGVAVKELPVSRGWSWLLKGKGGQFRLDVGYGDLAYFSPARRKTPDKPVEALLYESLYGDTSGYDQRTGKFNRGGIIYFDLEFEDYNVEEDLSAAEDGDEDAIENLVAAGIGYPPDLSKAGGQEFQAIAELEKMLGVKISNEGHSNSSLICKFSVGSWEEVNKVYDIIQRNTGGGEDQIYLDTPYQAAQGFTLYPDENLANGRSWGTNGRDGDLDEWLEDFKPGGVPGSKLASKHSACKCGQTEGGCLVCGGSHKVAGKKPTPAEKAEAKKLFKKLDDKAVMGEWDDVEELEDAFNRGDVPIKLLRDIASGKHDYKEASRVEVQLLDGDTRDVEWEGSVKDLLRDNAEDEEVQKAVPRLRRGQEYSIGGGASPQMIIKRL